MTSEPDSKGGRRPPTIELKATEVDSAAAPASGAAAAADASPQGASGPTPQGPRPGAKSVGRVKTHAISGILGAIAMAAIVAGLWIAGVLPPYRAALSPGATASDNAAIDAISARLNDIQGELRAEQAKSAQAKSAQAKSAQAKSPQPDPAIGARIAATDAETKSLGDSLAALNRRLDDIAAASQSAVAKADAAQAATAEAAKSASAAQAANQTNIQRSDLDALASRIAALENAVKALSENAARPAAGADDQAARLTIAAQALRDAVQREAPYRAELAAVQSLGVTANAVAPLEPFAATGIPGAAALAQDLAALTPDLRHASEPSSSATGFLGRLEANAQHLVRITPVDAPAGNEPSAVMARIEADAAHADIAAALTDIAALPEAAKPLAAGWAGKANARQAAIAASRQIAADALAGLSKPASQ
jgi:hypothetical protein